MKERWFNYRPLCLVFGFLLLGSIFSVYIEKFAIISIVINVCFMLKKKKEKEYIKVKQYK